MIGDSRPVAIMAGTIVPPGWWAMRGPEAGRDIIEDMKRGRIPYAWLPRLIMVPAWLLTFMLAVVLGFVVLDYLGWITITHGPEDIVSSRPDERTVSEPAAPAP